MKCKCPACGAVASLDVLVAHEGAREAILTALQLPESLGKVVIQYLGLFRPAKRDLSFDRVNSLLADLLPALRENRIRHKGRDWVVTREMWRAGMEAMLVSRDAGKLLPPLPNHNYLYAVLASMVDKTEAQAEQRREDQRQRGGEVWRSNAGPVAVGALTSPALHQGAPPAAPAPKPKQPMPAQVREAIKPKEPLP